MNQALSLGDGNGPSPIIPKVAQGLEEWLATLEEAMQPDPARLALARMVAKELDECAHQITVERTSDTTTYTVGGGVAASLVKEYSTLLKEFGAKEGGEDVSDPFASFASHSNT